MMSPAPAALRETSVWVDIAELLAGGLPEPPTPTSCRRTDGVGLFYPGQVNLLFGDPESGKTWVALSAASEALTNGESAVIVDADHNGANQIVHRLLALGVPELTLSDPARFRLCEPEDGRRLLKAVSEAEDWSPDLAVVDSVGEVVPLLGLGSNSSDDYTAANRMVFAPLARAGAAVIVIDHLAKGAESRQAGPTGTAAKRRAIGGVALRVTLREAFTPGQGGSCTLAINKDRPGGLRKVSPTAKGEAPAGVFSLFGDPDDPDGPLSWQITAPTTADVGDADQPRPRRWVPTEAQLDALNELAVDGELPGVRRIKKEMDCGQDRAQIMRDAWLAREARRASDGVPAVPGP